MLLRPEVALPIAGQLLGGQGNQQNFGNAMTVGGLAMGKQREVQAQTAQDSKTYNFFKQNNPEFAQMIDAGAPVDHVWKLYTEQRYAKEKGQGIINAGAGNLYNADTGEWLSAPGGGVEGAAGLTPVWLKDENGNPVIGQVTKDGRVLRSEVPEGLAPMGPYERAFESGAGGKAGEATGTAQGALPAAAVMAQRINQQVEELKSDPYLPRMLGPLDSRLPNVTADAARVQSKISQLNSGAFLEARQALKGGGAITDFESKKAEEAYARLNQAQTEEDFKAALDEFNGYIQMGLQKLQVQAAQGAPRAPGYGAAPPATGGQRYRFNPATGELE
jgi:hypothetical protein